MHSLFPYLHQLDQTTDVQDRALLGAFADQVGATLLPHPEAALPGNDSRPARTVERRGREAVVLALADKLADCRRLADSVRANEQDALRPCGSQGIGNLFDRLVQFVRNRQPSAVEERGYLIEDGRFFFARLPFRFHRSLLQRRHGDVDRQPFDFELSGTLSPDQSSQAGRVAAATQCRDDFPLENGIEFARILGDNLDPQTGYTGQRGLFTVLPNDHCEAHADRFLPRLRFPRRVQVEFNPARR